jgi:hypothetical protein
MLCDQRIRSKAYGRIFLDSLPPMPVTNRLSDVTEFLSKRLADIGLSVPLKKSAS